MAMDPKLASIIGVAPRKTNPIPPAPPTKDLETRIAINAGYMALGFPQLARTSNQHGFAFHERALAIIGEEAQASSQALARVDPDLRGDVRLARQAGITWLSVLATQKRLQEAATPIAKAVFDGRKAIDAVMNRQPADATKAILWLMRIAESRRQIEQMSHPEIADVAVTMASRGDEAFPEIFLNGVKPLISDVLAERLTKEYQTAVAGPAVAALDKAEEALTEAQAVIGVTETALGSALSSAGTLPGEWNKVPQVEIVKAWPKPAKASFIAAKGEEAYTALMRGTLELNEALDVFRPGLAEEK